MIIFSILQCSHNNMRMNIISTNRSRFFVVSTKQKLLRQYSECFSSSLVRLHRGDGIGGRWNGRHSKQGLA